MTVKSLGDLANITVQNVVGETLCWITIVNWQLPPRVEVGCLRHPGDSTIVSQLTDGDNSMANKCWQASYEPTRRKEKNKHSKHIANTWRKTWSNRGGETAYEKESPCLKCNKHSRKCCPMQKNYYSALWSKKHMESCYMCRYKCCKGKFCGSCGYICVKLC